jgi:hypothetical protein
MFNNDNFPWQGLLARRVDTGVTLNQYGLHLICLLLSPAIFNYNDTCVNFFDWEHVISIAKPVDSAIFLKLFFKTI